MKIYNNILKRHDSPLVKVFNPCDANAKPYPVEAWEQNGWFGHKTVVLDWEADNHVLVNVEPAAGVHSVVRERWFDIVEAARNNGAKTIGAYGIPWCNYSSMSRRVAKTTWAHIATLDWVTPSFYWYEEDVGTYTGKVQATTYAIKIATVVTGKKIIVPMVSIESMKKGGGARVLTDEEIRRQCDAVVNVQHEGLKVGGVLIWSMLDRWWWLHKLLEKNMSIGPSHANWSDFVDAKDQLAKRGIATQSQLTRFVGLEVARFRKQLILASNA